MGLLLLLGCCSGVEGWMMLLWHDGCVWWNGCAWWNGCVCGVMVVRVGLNTKWLLGQYVSEHHFYGSISICSFGAAK